ncbi:MAG TPA: PEP-CTERM sorting domain-containing protein, partial [Opitutaceae bacterium]|nr:PEP-CTERM sorting domain-containing protein [Opitutaceae bacterium]
EDTGAVPAAGTLGFGATTPLTFASGGNLYVAVTDANGAPGVGFGTVNAAGGLTVSSSFTAPFNVELISYTPGPDQSSFTDATGFNFYVPYSWVIASSPTTISGFTTGSIVVDTSEFSNDTNGGLFTVADTGNTLVLNFTPAPEPSTWAMIAGGGALLGLAGLRRSRRVRAG